MISLSSNLLILGSLGSIVLGWAMFFLSVFLILLVLVQRGKGGGLTGALGGPGGQSAFGSKAGDTFTLITAVSAVIWGLVCAIAMYTLGVPPVTADDVEFQVDESPVLTSPLDPTDESLGGGMSGLSGLSGLVPGESEDETVDQEDAEDVKALEDVEDATGTPSMDLTPAESTSKDSDSTASESADASADQPGVGGEKTDDSDAGATESE